MFCSYCGTENKIAGANFCSKCGNMLPKMESYAYQQINSPVKEQHNQPHLNRDYNNSLPSGVYYDSEGHLNWLYKSTVTEKYESAPIGTEYIIRYELKDQEIIRYRKQFLNYNQKEETKKGNAFYRTMDVLSDMAILFSDNDSTVDAAIRYSDLREEPSEIEGIYAYKKIKVIQPNPMEHKISIKYGIDKASLFVMSEQFNYIFAEIEKRCPKAIRGEVFKKQ
ncbi:MAG: zinc ribbon domain-containing protein [Eubacterium sp.]|nr:zinc ribbon domain-containing protein [Eubacterium sp.]